MIKSVLATTLVVLLMANESASALGGHTYAHHGGRYMSARPLPEQQPSAGLPARPLTQTARDAERAVIWQDSLHGEDN